MTINNTYLTVNAGTPEDRITGPIQTARAALLALVTDFEHSSVYVGERLVQKAQHVRDQENLAQAQLRYLELARGVEPHERLMRLLFNIAANEDHRWPESKRQSRAGVREWARHQMSMLGE